MPRTTIEIRMRNSRLRFEVVNAYNRGGTMPSIQCSTVVSVVALLLVSPVLCAEENEKLWTIPDPAGDVNSFGANIQRTMSLRVRPRNEIMFAFSSMVSR